MTGEQNFSQFNRLVLLNTKDDFLQSTKVDLQCEFRSFFACLLQKHDRTYGKCEIREHSLVGETFNTLSLHFWCIWQHWTIFSALYKWFNFDIYCYSDKIFLSLWWQMESKWVLRLHLQCSMVKSKITWVRGTGSNERHLWHVQASIGMTGH